ncbi:MAG: hypothetical protein GY715_15665 [Planctomycetes bacterium]|nr:hypothetical protein [Planctomycetota bacterium]
MTTATDLPEADLAAVWFLAARAMYIASGQAPASENASAGLYAQAILGVSEEACLEAKSQEKMGVLTLVDCLSAVSRLPHGVQEKIITGVMMVAYADRRMATLEVRWASMLASAAGLTTDEFQRICASARVIAAMLRPRGEAPDL